MAVCVCVCVCVGVCVCMRACGCGCGCVSVHYHHYNRGHELRVTLSYNLYSATWTCRVTCFLARQRPFGQAPVQRFTYIGGE